MGGPGGEEGSALDPCHLTALPLCPRGEPCLSGSGHSEWSQRTQRAEQGWADPAGTSAWAGRNACPSLASSSWESWANPRRAGLGTRRRKEAPLDRCLARTSGQVVHPGALGDAALGRAESDSLLSSNILPFLRFLLFLKN